METRTGADARQRGVHFETALLPEGWARNVRIEIADALIRRIELDVPALPSDERAGVGLAGMPNLHSHAFQRGMAGLTERRGPDDDSFWTWRKVMYGFVARLTPEDLEAIAAQAYVEMLESGFTRVGEFHYLHHDVYGRPYDNPAEMAARIAAAASQCGIGLTLLPVFYAHSGFGGAPPTPAQVRFVNNADRYARLIEASRIAVAGLDGAMVGIAPHSLRAVTTDELSAILPCAAGGPVHIHIAEQLREVEECLAWSGARPVDLLLDSAPVDGHWCLVHATHMTDAETVRLARSGAVAGLCPITEANLGDGIFPAAAFQASGGRFGVGSDSNVLISMSEELRLLEYGQRLTRRARNVMAPAAGISTGRALFDGAVSGGAQALGVGGRLEVGASADIITLNPNHPALVGRGGDDLLDSAIFAGSHGLIANVWRAGRRVVSDGVHHQRDVIAARFRATLERLLAA
ncbi:MAG TPA: formimidoylglutamate deiminase [Steroidobacteraceae bacterium]|nr:formimidoylglutamate deiminase [Steroidobacteraceae bacterium]